MQQGAYKVPPTQIERRGKQNKQTTKITKKNKAAATTTKDA